MKLKKRLCAMLLCCNFSFCGFQNINHIKASYFSKEKIKDSETCKSIIKIVSLLAASRLALDFAVKNIILGDHDGYENDYIKRVNDVKKGLNNSLSVENLSDYKSVGKNLVISMKYTKTNYKDDILNGLEYYIDDKYCPDNISRFMKGKCILVFGQSWSSAHRCVNEFPYIQDLLILGAKVIVYEYPERHSQGISGISKYFYRSGERIIESMEEIYNDLKKSYKPENIIFSGHSLGGATSTNLCYLLMNKGEKIGGLILHTPAHADFDSIRTSLLSIGSNKYLASTLKWTSWVLIDRFPGFPDMNTDLYLKKISTANPKFPVYISTGNDCDPFFLKYTELDKCLNKNSKYQIAVSPDESSKANQKVGHMEHQKMVWGRKFEKWLEDCFFIKS